MDEQDAQPLESRFPTSDDLTELCRLLNAEDASYLVIGGMAMIYYGSGRTTADIDILIDPSKENQRRIRKALEHLPDAAVNDMADDDLDVYQVVRIADEFVVDIMISAGGIAFSDADRFIEIWEHEGVRIPFASKQLMIRMKTTLRQKDALDKAFLLSIPDQEK